MNWISFKCVFSVFAAILLVDQPCKAQGPLSQSQLGLNAAQQIALDSFDPAFAAAVATARAALTASSLVLPANRADIEAKVGVLAQAEAALATARADLISRLQASPNRLNPAQLASVAQSGAGRGGRGGGAAPAGPAAPAAPAAAPVILLWPNGAPGALGEGPADKPQLTAYLVKRADGAPPAPAVVIAPGGGYFMVSAGGAEGVGTAQWLNSIGVSAFVLRYRVSPYRYPAEIEDGRRAIRLVRARAAEFGIDPGRLGMMGFSAGGHLAAITGTVFDAGMAAAIDPIDRASSRPDFLILSCPVISFNPAVAGNNNLAAYAGSGRNLLGDNPDPKLVQEMSAENRVTAAMPPTFIFHGAADTLVSPENSTVFFVAMQKARVPVELHTFEKGTHGAYLGLIDPIRESLLGQLTTWLRMRGVVSVDIP